MSENNQGWVKLHRRLLSNPVFKNPKLLQPFLYCLLKASHDDREQLVGDSIVQLKPGQLATGRNALSEATGLTSQNIRTALKKLENLGILTIKPTNKFSIISITNWDSYQQTNQQVTSSQPTTNQPANHKQEVKNLKNDKKKENTVRFAPPPLSDVTNYFNDRGCYDQLQAAKFIDFYESKGWMVGKNKMKDWKAAVRTWVGRNAQPIQQSDFGSVLR